MRRRWLFAWAWTIGTVLALTGCASRQAAVAIGVACYTCQWLEASGACAVTGTRGAAQPYCPPGFQPYIVNFESMMKRGEQPRIVCK